jgi:hypothetical protein
VKKNLFLFLLLLVFAGRASADGVTLTAHAQHFIYTYTVTLDPAVYGATFTTGPMPAVTTSTNRHCRRPRILFKGPSI